MKLRTKLSLGLALLTGLSLMLKLAMFGLAGYVGEGIP